MNRFRSIRYLFATVIALGALSAQNLLACAACYGKSDSPMAWGMNAGILTLLAIVAGVLCGISGFFVYIIRRASKISASSQNTKQH